MVKGTGFSRAEKYRPLLALRADPQRRITKTGNIYLRTLLVQSAQYILGHYGTDCALRRWGLRLAASGGKSNVS